MRVVRELLRILRSLAAAGVILAAAFVLQACLLGGGGSGGAKTSDDYLAEGDEHYRQGKFARSLAAYDSSILLDSAQSRAYYGHAKATLRFHGVSSSELLEDLDRTNRDTTGRIHFLHHPDTVLTRRLQASAAATRVLALLVDRDTLTRWWTYLSDSSAQTVAGDPLYAQRRQYMATEYFVKADLGVPGYRKADRFPLADGKLRYEAFAVDFGLLSLAHAFIRVADFDGNGVVDFGTRDSLSLRMSFNSEGPFDSLGNLMVDSLGAGDLNALLLQMGEGMNGNICRLLAEGCASTDSLPAAGLDSILDDLGGTVAFYLIADKRDNDGDGCVDEEFLDGKDNDFDGFIDEDSRVVRLDQVDNDRSGGVDDVAEDTVGAAVSAAHPHQLGFVRAWLSSTAPPETTLVPLQTSWVKIKKDVPAGELQERLNVQKDSLDVRIPRGGPVPDSLVARLQNARNIVGGCWRNYP